MSTTRHPGFLRTRPAHCTFIAVVALLVAASTFAAAQTTPAATPSTPVALNLVSKLVPDLPDAPSSLVSSSLTATDTDRPSEADDPQATPAAPPSTPRTKRAPHLKMTIAPDEIADPMSVHDKVVGGLIDSVSFFAATGWVAAAGWEQIWNDSPNYGTDAGAFGQRLGASVIRGVSEGVLSESFFAPVFHEDPRYYIMGQGHPFFKRLVYAGTRAIITRTDGGRTVPNFWLIAGNAAGSAITVTYYPAKNTTFSEVAQTFGGSLGGSALGFVVDEFIVDALIDLHIKKKQPQP